MNGCNKQRWGSRGGRGNKKQLFAYLPTATEPQREEEERKKVTLAIFDRKMEIG